MTEKPIFDQAIKAALSRTAYAEYLSAIWPINANGYQYEDLFRIGTDPEDSYVIKIRPKTAKNVYNALKCFAWLADEDDLLEKYHELFEVDDRLVLVTKWVAGSQPCEENRDRIPDFFRRLAGLHKNNICSGPVTSMYADGRSFDAVEEMIDAEMDYHHGFYELSFSWDTCLQIVDSCKRGLTCAVHEDIHPGNMFLPCNGDLLLIDCEWLHRGLNLHQFQHIDFFGRGKPAFYKIRKEAAESYRAYFKEIEVNEKEANDQIRGFEMLSAIRWNTYWRYNGIKDASTVICKYIEEVINQDSFI
jgi:hypothetical protein